MVKNILITGANSGLGKDSARQFALLNDTEKIYIGARSHAKAEAAITELEQVTGKSIFEAAIIDTTDLDGVRQAVANLPEQIDTLIMNAGGMGGTTPGALTSEGVTQIFASNVLGHVVLVDELLKANKLTQSAIYVGSEAARGVSRMGMARPVLSTGSVDEFVSLADGSYFGEKFDGQQAYGWVKYIATLWMSSLARQYPNMRFLTVSPGGTAGTNVFSMLPAPLVFILKNAVMPIMMMIGMFHSLETGAKRYVDVAIDTATYKSGKFYASPDPGVTGNMVDQATIMSDLDNETYQNNANEAIHNFIPQPVTA